MLIEHALLSVDNNSNNVVINTSLAHPLWIGDKDVGVTLIKAGVRVSQKAKYKIRRIKKLAVKKKLLNPSNISW